MSITPRAARVIVSLSLLVGAARLEAVEKASDQVSAFYGSFSQALPIQVPPYHGLEPKLSLAYSSEGRNGFAGVGWNLTGISTIERANAGRGTPHFDSADIYLLDGQELVPCQAGSVSPSCTTGGTHSTKQESYLKIKFDAAANTWTIWGKDGTRTVLTSILTVPPNAVVTGGTLVWGQTSAVDTHANTVTYAWACAGGDCYPDTVSYNGYQVRFYRESRTDTLSQAAASILRTTLYRLRSVIVQLGSSPIRGYKISYTTSALTGRSLVSSVQMYGKDLTQDGSGLITAGTALPAQTFTYQNDAIGKSFASWALPPTGNTTEAVTWANRVNVAPYGSGNGILKNGGVNGNWDAGATSTRALASGNGYLQFTATNVFDATGNGIGLSNGNTDTNWADIDFGLYLFGSQVYVIEAGLQPFHTAVAENDTLRVEVTPTSVTYKKNGVSIYTHAATPHYPLLIDSSMRTTNTVLSNAFISGNLSYVNAWCQGGPFLTGDFNGDGRTDQLCSSYSLLNGQPVNPRIEVALANGNGFAVPTLWSSALGLVAGRVTVGDVNGDGKSDLAVQSPDAVISVMVSNGTSFAAPVAWGTATGTRPGGGLASCNGSDLVSLGTGDFNGDGITDISCKRVDDTAVHIGLSNGTSGFSFSVWAGSSCDVYNRVDSSIDFDGDGKDDWYCIGATNGMLVVMVSTGSSFVGGVATNLSGTFCPSDYYALGDLNGDGRTDAFCTLNGRVALSLGRTWAAPTADLPPWCTTSGVDVFAADVDGDGASEIVCNNTGNGADDIQVRKFKGGALAAVETWKASWCTGKVSAGDWNGDGKADLYCASAADPAVAGTAALQADLMAAAGTGLGGTVSATYVPASSFQNTNDIPARNAISTLSLNDGRGGLSTTTFSYSGGLVDHKERLFLGFAYAKTTKPCVAGETTCPYLEQWFRQDLPALGLPSKTDERDGANRYHRVALYEYATSSAGVLPRSALLTGERMVFFDGSGCATWPCAGTRETYATQQYDAYGNLLSSVAYGDAGVTGDEITTALTYTPNTSLYIVDRPATIQRTGPAGSLLAKHEIWYDGANAATQAPVKGDATTERDWLDSEARWIASTLQYDAYGNLVVASDATSRQTTTAYDTTYHVFPTSVTNAASETSLTSWDAVCAVPSQSTDPNAQGTSFQTDALCRASRTDYPLGYFEEWSYLQLGTPTAQRAMVSAPAPGSPFGGVIKTITNFDGLGRTYRNTLQKPVGQGLPTTINVDTTFNARSQVAAVTQPYYGAGPGTTTTQFAYDVLGRPVATTLPDGNLVTASYGVWTTTARDEHQHPTTTAFDAYGRALTTTRVIGESAVTTTRTYDLLGRLTAVQDGAGISWTWTRDSLGRARSTHDPDAGNWSYQYDDAGRPTDVTDGKGQVTHFDYDAGGRSSIKHSLASGETITFQYSEGRSGYFNVGRVTTVQGPGTTGNPGPQATFDYDAAGRGVRAIKTLNGVPYVMNTRYDSAGRVTGLTYPDGEVIGSDSDPFQYDGFGRLVSIPGILNALSYDAAGRPTVQTNANGTVTTRTFSAARGFLSHIDTAGPAGSVQSLDYGRDAAGLATSVTSPFANETWNYAYDELHRLTAATAGNPPSPPNNESFTYDAIGRMTSNLRVGSYTYPGSSSARPHAPATAGAFSFSYDANGNLLSGAGRTLTWNPDNLPVSVITSTGATSFGYDGLGSRVQKTSGANTTLYPFGDDYEIVNGLVTKYVSVGGLGTIAKRTAGQTYWLHGDQLGSIEAITDAAGALVQRRAYFPYGDKLADATGHVESRGFIDQRQDDETGLTYLHARYYDPRLGVFLSPDPMAPGASEAAYSYASDNPVNRMDPTGLTDGLPPLIFVTGDDSGHHGFFWNLIHHGLTGKAGLAGAGLYVLSKVVHGIGHFLFGNPSGPATPQLGLGDEQRGNPGVSQGGGDGGGGGGRRGPTPTPMPGPKPPPQPGGGGEGGGGEGGGGGGGGDEGGGGDGQGGGGGTTAGGTPRVDPYLTLPYYYLPPVPYRWPDYYSGGAQIGVTQFDWAWVPGSEFGISGLYLDAGAAPVKGFGINVITADWLNLPHPTHRDSHDYLVGLNISVSAYDGLGVTRGVSPTSGVSHVGIGIGTPGVGGAVTVGVKWCPFCEMARSCRYLHFQGTAFY